MELNFADFLMFFRSLYLSVLLSQCRSSREFLTLLKKSKQINFFKKKVKIFLKQIFAKNKNKNEKEN